MPEPDPAGDAPLGGSSVEAPPDGGPPIDAASAGGRFRQWLLADTNERAEKVAPHVTPKESRKTPWWRVMCLTGLDYFSTLGYQPGIAALAAGLVSPIATIVLVALTLFGALPVYRRVAAESPHGQGSIAMLERVLPRWWGKFFVLALLGFAVTDFIITITLSAADATAHVLENPFIPGVLAHQQIAVTLILIAGLGAVFLRGFKEAVGIAVALVGVYLLLNLVVVAVSVAHVGAHPALISDWRHMLTAQHSGTFGIALVALVVFPKLALGLSGFETGVAVMPLIKGAPSDTEERPVGRIRGARRLLTTAALIMSVFLIASSVVTTLLIPQREFQTGGSANGRALAYLAHQYLGSVFGSFYDVSTVCILWFAGASAMAGLLNLVPRYLPHYGMAPAWTSHVRPLVFVFTFISVVVTLIFKASVDAQGGAYATGVLVLITSAAVAVTLSLHRRGKHRGTIAFGTVTLVFVYTTIDNIMERPDGVKIAGVFIATIIIASVLSRAVRSTELRATDISLDSTAKRIIAESTAKGPLRIVANEPDARDAEEYRDKLDEQRKISNIPERDPVVFLEVTVRDASEFEGPLAVQGEIRHGYQILCVESTTIGNAIAAMLLYIRDTTGELPHIYFTWTEGNPIVYLLRYLLFGDGEIAPITREVLREAEPDPAHRPVVHVG